MMLLTPENALLKYLELKTLQKTSKYFQISLETLRKYFITNKIPYKKRAKFTCNDNFFSKDSPESFYWAGFIAADGNIEKDSNRICLCLNIKDRDHLIKFKNIINLTAEILDEVKLETRPEFKYSEYHSSKIRFNSKKMVIDLNDRFGIYQQKSKTLSIKSELIESIYFSHFIRGLIDGDGWIYTNKNSSEVGLSGTTETVNCVFEYLIKIINIKSGSVYIRADGLGIFSSKLLEDNIKIINFIYKDCNDNFLERKLFVANKILQCKPRKFSISKENIYFAFKNSNDITDVLNHLQCSKITLYRRLLEFEIKEDIKNNYNNLYSKLT